MNGYYRPHVQEIVAVDWGSTLYPNSGFLDIVADLNEPPIPDLEPESCDTVILSDVLEHIRTPERLLEELHRILKPGGHLLLNVPFYFPIHEDPYDFHRFTRYALRGMLERTGFTVLQLDDLGGGPAVWIDLTSKSLSYLGFPGRMLASLLQWTTWRWRNVSFVKRFLGMKKEAAPLSSFVVAARPR